MIKAFQRLWGNREDESTSSGEVAKERLRLVLAHDRTSISPALLDTLKDEIIAVISRHVSIDAGEVEVTISQNARESRLVADIPLAGRHKRGR
ncbi:MAG TPA: cell division topological specificity factor MinE [Chloroflexi bacterium]|nr:cell division topological specificity factor MinE [Chloroflexota bacterium]